LPIEPGVRNVDGMKAASQKRLRNLHNWLGVFFAPGIIFFAFSGIFQTLGLHESGPDRQPAVPFIGVLASIHKEGEASLPKRRAPPPQAPGKPNVPPEHDKAEAFPFFKLYTLLLSASLILSVSIGVVIALINPAARRRTWALLGAGCAIPLLLLVI
jgi:hypothetical protein